MGRKRDRKKLSTSSTKSRSRSRSKEHREGEAEAASTEESESDSSCGANDLGYVQLDGGDGNSISITSTFDTGQTVEDSISLE